MSVDREQRAEQVIRSHSRRIIENREEIRALKVKIRRIEEFLERQEKRGVAWIPTSALRHVFEHGDVGCNDH